MASRKQIWPPRALPPSHDLAVEIDGANYEGSYFVEKGQLVVSLHRDGRSKKAMASPSDNAVLAKLLLHELVAECRQST
jgi:hypothetical protein